MKTEKQTEVSLRPSEIIEKYGDLPIHFLVYSCGCTSSFPLTDDFIKIENDCMIIESDLN